MPVAPATAGATALRQDRLTRCTGLRVPLSAVCPAGETTLVQIRAARAATGRRALGDWTEQDLTQLTALLRRFGAAIDIED